MAWALCGCVNTDDIHPASEARSNFKHHKVKEGGGGFYGISGFHPTFMSLISLDPGVGSMGRAKQELLTPCNEM